jgi:hypothetical protein
MATASRVRAPLQQSTVEMKCYSLGCAKGVQMHRGAYGFQHSCAREKALENKMKHLENIF